MLKRVQFPHKPISCPSSDQTKPIEVIVFLRSFIIQSDLGGGLTEGCMSALPIHPLGWDMRLSSILDGDFNYFCGRKMLAHGWINWSSSGRCKGWDGLSWISLLLAGFLLFLLAGLFFYCVTSSESFTCNGTSLYFKRNWTAVMLATWSNFNLVIMWSISQTLLESVSPISPLQCKCMLESPSLKSCFNSVHRTASCWSFPLSHRVRTPFLVSVLVGWALMQAYLPVVGG